METDKRLEELNKEKIAEYSPVIAFVFTMMLLGIVGNSFSITYYRCKAANTTTNVLITILSFIDLVSCVVIVGEVIELFYPVNFRSAAGCKAIYFLEQWLVFISGTLLLLIAFDRYRRICRPFEWQLSIKTSKRCALVIVVVCFIMAFRNIFVMDVVRVNILIQDGQSLTGYYCTHTDDASFQTLTVVFHVIDFVIFIIILSTAVAMYVCIAVAIFKQRKRLVRNTTYSKSDESGFTSMARRADVNNEGVSMISKFSTEGVTSTSLTDTGDIKRDSVNALSFSLNALSPGVNALSSSVNALSSSVNALSPCTVGNTLTCGNTLKAKKNGIKARETFNVEKKVTQMLVCAFIASIVSFVPHFVMHLEIKGHGHHLQEEFNAGYQTVHRLFKVNHIVNPYIFCAFNSKFRNYVKNLVWMNNCRT